MVAEAVALTLAAIVGTLVVEHVVGPAMLHRSIDALTAWRERGFAGCPRVVRVAVLALTTSIDFRTARQEFEEYAARADALRALADATPDNEPAYPGQATDLLRGDRYQQANEATRRAILWAKYARRVHARRSALWRWWRSA